MQYFRGATLAELIAIRLDHDEEVVPRLQEVIQETQTVSGAILTGVGLLDHFHLEVAANLNWPPTAYAIEKQGPGNIISAQGHVVNGVLSLAMCVSRRNEVHSGLVLPATRVLHYAEFTLLRAGNTRWTHVPNAQTGVPLLQAASAPQTSGAPVQLMGRPVDPAAIALVPPALLRKHTALPVARTADTLVVAMVDPNNPFAVDDLRAATGLRIQTVAVPARELLAALHQALQGR